MSHTFVILGLIAVSIAAVSASKECYVCNSAFDFKSSKACKKDTFDTTKVPVVRAPDSKKECYVCFKSIGSDDEVERGCLSKSEYKSQKDTYDLKGDDDCGKSGGAEYCICPNNYCNGAGLVSFSVFTLLATALLKMLF